LTQAIEPALASGTTVLCDRFTDSTFAYQGAGRGFDAGVLQQLESWVQHDLQPDLTLWFDIRPEQAAQRLSTARSPDRFEQLDTAFFHRVRHGYEQRARSHARRFVRIDAGLDRESVASQVADVLKARGW
jgi:dTMP kinase